MGWGLLAENPLGWQHGGILEQVPGGANRAPGGAVDDSPSDQVEATPVKLDPAPQPVWASGAVIGEEGDAGASRLAQAPVSGRPGPQPCARADDAHLGIAGANVISASVLARVDDDHLERLVEA